MQARGEQFAVKAVFFGILRFEEIFPEALFFQQEPVEGTADDMADIRGLLVDPVGGNPAFEILDARGTDAVCFFPEKAVVEDGQFQRVEFIGGSLFFVNVNNRGAGSFCHRTDRFHEFIIKTVDLLIVRIFAIDTRAVKKFRREKGADPLDGGYQSLFQGMAVRGLNGITEGFRRQIEIRDFSVRRRGYISSARKCLTVTVDIGGQSFDGVNDVAGGQIHQDDIAVFAHDLDDEAVIDRESQFIDCVSVHDHDPLRIDLTDRPDTGTLHMFAQQHAESRWILGIGILFFSQVQAGVAGTGGDEQPVFFFSVADLQDDFICGRLMDAVDPSACQFVLELVGDRGGNDAVKCHDSAS